MDITVRHVITEVDDAIKIARPADRRLISDAIPATPDITGGVKISANHATPNVC